MEEMQKEKSQSSSFWSSRAGRVALAFLIIVGLLMAYEHRIHLFTGNGLLVLLLFACVGVHLFMHGGHGGHGGHGSNTERE